mmetsp:Transcript_16711/g.31799  ORF Transcript_16711/g.31799 Transcript_16711/m.31799 type:complete len:80 (-) Transcript_16711:152-391(-)
MKYAQQRQPKKLKHQDTVQFRRSLRKDTLPPNTPATKTKASPVNNSADVKTTAKSPVGNRLAPKIPPPATRYKCPAAAM